MELRQVSWRQTRCSRGGHRVTFHRQMARQNQARLVFRRSGESGRPGGELANIIGHRLGKKEAIDSYDLLPVFKGEVQQALRVATVQNTSPKKFALRQGDGCLRCPERSC